MENRLKKPLLIIWDICQVVKTMTIIPSWIIILILRVFRRKLQKILSKIIGTILMILHYFMNHILFLDLNKM